MKQWRTFLTQRVMVLHCALFPVNHKDLFKAQRLSGEGKEQATVFPPHRLFDTMCNGRSESLAYWGITATSG